MADFQMAIEAIGRNCAAAYAVVLPRPGDSPL